MRLGVLVGYDPRSRTLDTPEICTNGGLERTSETYVGSNASSERSVAVITGTKTRKVLTVII